MGKTYPNEIKRVLYLPGGPVGKECRKVSLEIAEESKRTAESTLGKNPADRPRTGQMARAYKVVVVPGTNTFIVVNPKKYAAAIELGARPHEIHARVSVLEFRGRDGRWRRVKMVRHPGSAAHNILLNSARAVMKRRYGVG